MLALLSRIWKALKGLISPWCEPGGQGSSTRIHLALVVLGSMGLAWYSTVTGKDIAANALVIILTLLGSGTSSYFWNKAKAPKSATPQGAPCTPEAPDPQAPEVTG